MGNSEQGVTRLIASSPIPRLCYTWALIIFHCTLLTYIAAWCAGALLSSHRGSTLLRFHLDWARTSHQWRWCPFRWWLPPDHQMFTIFLIASCLGLQKYFGLGKSKDFCLSSITVWLYLCIGKVDTTSSSSTHDRDHHCQQDDHAGCIGELDPGGSLVSDATRLDNHETLLIHRL